MEGGLLGSPIELRKKKKKKLRKCSKRTRVFEERPGLSHVKNPYPTVITLERMTSLQRRAPMEAQYKILGSEDIEPPASPRVPLPNGAAG